MARHCAPVLVATVVLLAGCSAMLDLEGDFARDGGPDTGGPDTGTDAGADGATADAGPDGGDPSVCMPPQPPAVSDCGPGGETLVLVVSRLQIARTDATTGQTPGFNIDGCNTAQDGPTGCGHMDGVYDMDGNGVIEGLEHGIDNQMAAAANLVEAFVSLEELVREGRLLLLFEITGVDDPTDDDCVDVAILQGRVPDGGALESDGIGILAGQTFDVDDRSFGAGGDALASGQGRIEDGRLLLGPMTLPFAVRLDQGRWAPTLHNAQVTHVMASTEGSVMGGGISMKPMEDLSAAAAGGEREDARSLLETFVDLEPDANNDNCEQLSAGFEFSMVSASLGGVVSDRTCEADWPLAWWVDAGEPCKTCMCGACSSEVLSCLDNPACVDLVECALQHGCADEACVFDNCSEHSLAPEASLLYLCMANSGCNEFGTCASE
jgi:hypothetical protein